MSQAKKLAVLVNFTQRITMGMNFWMLTNPQKAVIAWMQEQLQPTLDPIQRQYRNGTEGLLLPAPASRNYSSNSSSSCGESSHNEDGLKMYALMMALSTWCGLLGTLVSNVITELKGAQFTMLGSSVMLIIGEFLCFSGMQFTQSLPLLFVGQMVVGVTNGFQNSAPNIYLNEIACVKDRALFSSSTGVCSKIGGVLIMILGLDVVLGRIERVRYLFLVPMIPSLLHLILCMKFVKTPAFLQKESHSTKQVENCIIHLYGTLNVNMDLDLEEEAQGRRSSMVSRRSTANRRRSLPARQLDSLASVDNENEPKLQRRSSMVSIGSVKESIHESSKIVTGTIRDYAQGGKITSYPVIKIVYISLFKVVPH